MCAKLWTKWTKFAHFKQNLHILKLQNCFIVPFPSRVETAADVIGPLYSLYHANTQNLMYTVGGEQLMRASHESYLRTTNWPWKSLERGANRTRGLCRPSPSSLRPCRGAANQSQIKQRRWRQHQTIPIEDDVSTSPFLADTLDAATTRKVVKPN